MTPEREAEIRRLSDEITLLNQRLALAAAADNRLLPIEALLQKNQDINLCKARLWDARGKMAALIIDGDCGYAATQAAP